MRAQETALAGLLLRRLTHDLAGPVTALGTLAALREAEPLEDAAFADLRDRLGLFRAVFAGAPDSAVDLGEAAALFARQADGLVVTLELDPSAAPARLRAALALGMEARSLLAEAGGLHVSVAASGAIRVEAEPLARAVPAPLAEACAGAVTGLSPQHALAAFAVALAGPLSMETRDRLLVLAADPV
jgi:hypothetical protein